MVCGWFAASGEAATGAEEGWATVGVADRAATIDAPLGDTVIVGGTEAAALDSAPPQAATRKIAPSAV